MTRNLFEPKKAAEVRFSKTPKNHIMIKNKLWKKIRMNDYLKVVMYDKFKTIGYTIPLCNKFKFHSNF
jgi:hypothetical protein